MAKHKVAILNGVFPRFRSTPARYRNPIDRRAKYIADLVLDDPEVDCMTMGEFGKPECAALKKYLPWKYDRAQGKGLGTNLEGLNSCWSNPNIWDQPEPGPGYNLPSGAQWVRTLMLAKITEKKAPDGKEPGFVTLGAYHETLGNVGGMAYIMAMIAKIGERRVLLGGDFKRTDDDDDIAVMKKAGFVFHERVDSTPMTLITQHGVKVTDVDHRTDARAFDHDYLIGTFSIPNPAIKVAV